MLSAVSMALGVSVLWLLLTQQWSTPVDFAVALAVGLIALVSTARVGGPSPAFTRLPSVLLALFRRIGTVIGGAMATLRAALAADIILKPGLVRVKSSLAGRDASAFSGMVTMAPGAAVIDTDDEGMFVHVLNEDLIDAGELGQLQHEADSARRGRPL